MQMRVCEFCLQEFKSRGENVKVIEHGYSAEDDYCEFCDEDIHSGEDYFEIKEG